MRVDSLVERRDTFVPLSDGTRLSARLWLPARPLEGTVPAILEYIPYRKGDATAPRDADLHGELAKHGFACVRVDLRGCGDSDGFLRGEYLSQELADGLEVIAWLASQEWCNGHVGMIGKSWGGFNALQLAALGPPALRCVVSVCSTDDRYCDDVHYTGGCVVGSAALSWSTTMLAYTARPPDPQHVGSEWRSLWLKRLRALKPFSHDWLAHQRRDAFWRHGSVCEAPDAIQCPVYMVGGWMDPYRGAVLRLLGAAPSRVTALIGPWAHVYPHEASFGQAIEFRELCRRFFDRHLKGVGPGLEGEPRLRAWMQESFQPRFGEPVLRGRWIGESSWPPPDLHELRLFLSEGGLGSRPGAERTLTHQGTLSHGSDGPVWLPWGRPGEAATDQRAEDGRSLAFDSDPLVDVVELLGVPVVEIDVIPDGALGQISARLCDVHESGISTLITFGVLNLCHNAGHAEPVALIPDRPLRVEVDLTAIAYSVPAGHRLRLALSSCYWPWAWPAPGSLRLRVRVGPDAVLRLPVRPVRASDDQLPALPSTAVQQAAGELHRHTHNDQVTGRLTSTIDAGHFGSFRLEDGLEYFERGYDEFTVRDADPLSAIAKSRWEVRIRRDAWSTRVVAESSMTANERTFQLVDELVASEADAEVFSERWTATIPRDHG